MDSNSVTTGQIQLRLSVFPQLIFLFPILFFLSSLPHPSMPRSFLSSLLQPFVEEGHVLHSMFLPRYFAVAIPVVAGVLLIAVVGEETVSAVHVGCLTALSA